MPEMMKILPYASRAVAAAAIALLAVTVPPAAAAQSAVFVVRHAERADTSADSVLSAAGEARAALKLTPATLPVSDTDALVARVRAAPLTSRILIVGHSNTVPEILKRLGVATPITIADTEYDNLFIAIPQESSAALLLQLKY
jgi:hypothetical protein